LNKYAILLIAGATVLSIVAWFMLLNVESRDTERSLASAVTMVSVDAGWKIVRDRSTPGSWLCGTSARRCPRHDVLLQTDRVFTRDDLIALVPGGNLSVEKECTDSPEPEESWIRCMGFGALGKTSITLISVDAGIGEPNLLHLILEPA
jgi:hypothetical protein